MKKTPGRIALFLIMLILLGCYSADTTRPQEKSLSVAALSGLLRGHNPPRVIYTGSLLQWQDEHIPASRCVPCDATAEAIEPLLRDWETPLVLYGNGPLGREACPLISLLAREGKKPLFVLSGGLAAWKKKGLATDSTERIPRLAVPGISAVELEDYRVKGNKPLILDVRPATAFAAGPIAGALNIPLTQLHERYEEIPLDRPVVVVGEGRGETLLAASFLLRKGVLVAARLQGALRASLQEKAEGGKSR